MLRRKLITRFAPLVGMMLLAAVIAIWLLEGVMRDLHSQAGSAAIFDPRHEALIERFRWLVLGLTAVFVVLINVSVLLLLQTAGMVLRPIDQLIQATHQLADGRFDYRVNLGRRDEFDQLADAYNALAARLQANEARKLEVLGQAAVSMNHELNNATSIIELQLHRLARQKAGGAEAEKCLREIHAGLRRMTTAVQALGNARRIVLTEYVPGMKMLDLEKSVQSDEQEQLEAAAEHLAAR